MSTAAVPAGYGALLTTVEAEVRTARLRARRVVNTELLTLYWTIGDASVAQQAAEGWGPGVITRLADDLRAEFPDVQGFSGRNLQYMATAATTWPLPIAQQAVAQLPWGHVTVLLDKLDDPAERNWYAAAAVEHGWSRNVLLHQIMNRLRTRTAAVPSNFSGRLPTGDLELAQQFTKDPYVFDFLGLTTASPNATSSRLSWTGCSRPCWSSAAGLPSSAGRSTSTTTVTMVISVLTDHEPRSSRSTASLHEVGAPRQRSRTSGPMRRLAMICFWIWAVPSPIW